MRRFTGLTKYKHFCIDKTMDTKMYKLPKIGVISCEDLSKWGGEAGYCKLFIDLFESKSGLSTENNMIDVPNINWSQIHAITGKLPSEEELKDYNGFLMTGSHYSVNEERPWMLKLEEWIRKVQQYQENNEHKPKLVGLCFSHQLINKALGGKVGNNPQNEFVWNAENIQLNSYGEEHVFFNSIKKSKKNNFRLLETHGECVIDPAPRSITIASSSTCEHEIIAINEHILTVQSHPESTAELMIEKILPSLKAKGLITDEKATESIASFKDEMDDKLFIKMIELFLMK